MDYIEILKGYVEQIPFMNLPVWDVEILGNTLKLYAIATVVAILLIVVFKLFQVVVISRLKALTIRTKTELDDTLIKIVQAFRPPFYVFLSIYLVSGLFDLSAKVSGALSFILTIWIVYYGVRALDMLLKYGLGLLAKKQDDLGSKVALNNLGKIGTGLLWLLGILMVLSNLGVEITSLIAGLGVGGLAIAIALQGILSDLFASFAIRFDKPFVEGDFIVIGEHLGVVEKIGIKTTRIRALQGEEIVISNQELMSSRVQNFKKLQERRVVTNFGVEYGTTSDKLKKINEAVKIIVDKIDNIRFDRSHFKSFGDSALVFEVVYYVSSPDYNEYMDHQQEFNFGLKEAVEKIGVSMAFPTQTIHIVTQK
ncbi:MAG: mechanosensitive ion channel family protein [Candidatus Paceibacterota bacterium]